MTSTNDEHAAIASEAGGTAVAVVTGGARGIGKTLTDALAGSGYRVVIADVIDEGKAAADELRGQGLDVTWHRTDVADEESVAGLARLCGDAFGRADVLVNNASIYADLGGKRPFTEISVAEWERVMRVNVTGTWLATRALHPLLAASPAGRVINIASSTALMGVPYFLHYVASKGAVIAMTRALAKEAGADGVTVNAIAPGLVQNESSARLNDDVGYFSGVTRQRAIARGMDPDDLVGAVLFLASPSSGFITGQTLVVDGGVTFN